MVETPGDFTGRAQLSEEEGSLLDYARLFWRRKWLIVAVTVVGIGVSALLTFRQTPIFQTSASLIVDQRVPQVLGNVTEVVDISPHAYRDTDDYMQTQVAVACSTAVLERVAEKLNLKRVDEFWPPPGPRGRVVRTDRQAAARLAGLMGCSARRSASIIDIVVEHPSAQLAARIATTAGQVFIDHNMEHKLSSAANAVKWLSQRSDELKTKVERAEGELYRFRKDNDLVSMTLEDRQGLRSAELRTLSSQLNGARARRIELQAQVEQLRSVDLKDTAAIPALSAFRNPLLDELKLGLVRAASKYHELSDRYGAKHPTVIGHQTKVEQATRNLTGEVRNLIVGSQRDLKQAQRTEVMLAAAIDKTKQTAFAANKREMGYRRLQRDAEGARRLYALLQSRVAESDLTQKLRSNNVRLLEKAFVPGWAVRPRPRLNLLIGALAGLLLGLGLSFLLHVLDTRVVGQEDVHAEGLVYLGSMPPVSGVTAGDAATAGQVGQVRELVAQQFPMSRAAEECRAIRTNLLFASPDRPLKRVVVTSPGSGDGKSLVAANLAIITAQQGAKVLLVDADMRRGRLHRIFGVPARDGLTHALRSDEQLDDLDGLIKCTEIPTLKLLPCGAVPPNPAELCHSARLRQMFDRLSERFDLVIIDSPPVLPVTDGVILSAFCDGTLLVARSGQTVKGGLREAHRRLVDVGAHLLGCVVNDADSAGSRYGYRYAKRYAPDGAVASAPGAGSPSDLG